MPPLAVTVISIALTALASVMLGVVVRRSSESSASGAGGLVFDVWGPIVLVLPFVGACGQVGQRLDAAGWPIVGGPVVLGLLGIGAALLLGGPGGGGGGSHRFARGIGGVGRAAGVGRVGNVGNVGGRALGCWAATGIALVMLSAANELTVLVGQTAFAIAAVMLWLNTPGHRETGGGDDSGIGGGGQSVDGVGSGGSMDDAGGVEGVGGWLLLGAIVLAGVHAVMIWRSDGVRLPITAGGVIVGGMWVMLCAAKSTGASGGAVRLAGWTATLGVLLALGLLALRELLPEAWAVARLGKPALVENEIVYGFGRFAPEAVMLALLPGLALLAGRKAGGGRVAIGLGVLAGAAGLAVLRLLAMGG